MHNFQLDQTSETNGIRVSGQSGQIVHYSDSQLKPSIDTVDELADELVKEYDNPGWRAWYCGAINQFGVEQIKVWQMKSKGGKSPAHLFSHYVKQARSKDDAQVAHTQAQHDHDRQERPGDVILTAEEFDAMSGQDYGQQLDAVIDKLDAGSSVHTQEQSDVLPF